MSLLSIGGINTEEIRSAVNHHDYRLAREIFHTFDFVTAIKHILLQKVFGAGIHLYADEESVELDAPHRKAFLERWTTLGRKIFEEWYTLGIVPYRWTWNAEQEVMLPVILAETLGATYRMNVVTTAWAKRYEFYGVNADKPDPTVLFLDDFNASPQQDGALTSPIIQLKNLYFSYILINTLKHKAAGLKAIPRLVAETAEPGVPPAVQNVMPAPELFRQNLALREAESSGFASNDILHQVQRQAADNRHKMNEAWEQARHMGKSSSYRDLMTQVCVGGPTVLTVNERQKITAAPSVSEPDDFIEHEKMLKQGMATALQVPYAVIVGDTTSRAAATATDLTLPGFLRLIVYLKMKMSHVLTDLFQEMTRRTRERRIQKFQDRVSKKRARRRLEQEYVRFEWEGLDERTIKLDLINNDIQDMERLAFLYTSNLLPYADFVHELLSSVPFNQTKREALEQRAQQLPDPLTAEEKVDLSKDYLIKLLGTQTDPASRAQDKETRDGLTSLSLSTRAKRKRTGSPSAVVEPTAANLH